MEGFWPEAIVAPTYCLPSDAAEILRIGLLDYTKYKLKSLHFTIFCRWNSIKLRLIRMYCLTLTLDREIRKTEALEEEGFE